MPRVASRNPLDGKPKTLQRTMFGDRFDGILGAGRMEAAGRRKQGPDQPLITLHQQQQKMFHSFTARIRSSAALSSSPAFRHSVRPGCLRNLITTSRLDPCRAIFLNCSRINLLRRFLATAVGATRLLTVTPRRACPALLSSQWIANQLDICALLCSTREKPSRRCKR